MELGLQSIDYVIMIGYLVFVIAVGFYFSRSTGNTEDYFLGGRKMPSFVIGISMFVTLFSAISFVAVPAEAFQHGLSMYFNNFLVPFAIVLGFWLFVRFYFIKKTFTPFEYLENRYSPSIRLFTCIIWLWVRLTYLGVVLYASAKLFQGVTGWPVWFTILLVGSIGVFYTLLGGMKAVAWTDVLQFFLIAVGIGWVLYTFGSSIEGGWPEIISYAFKNNRGFEAQKNISFFIPNPYERVTLWWAIISVLTVYVFHFGADQLTIQRLLSTKSYKDAKRSTLVMTIISLGVMQVFWICGLGLFVFYDTVKAGQLPAGIHPNEVFSFFIMNELPSPIPGLLMAALLAAVMSTVDSGTNSLSAVFIKDIYKKWINPNADERKEVILSKVFTFVWGVVFITFGITISSLSGSAGDTILETAGIWNSLLGIAGGTFLLGVTTTRSHTGTIWVSAVAGVAATLLIGWRFYYALPVDERISFQVVSNIPFIVMMLVGYALCLLWPRTEQTSIEGLTLWTFMRQNTQDAIQEKVNDSCDLNP